VVRLEEPLPVFSVKDIETRGVVSIDFAGVSEPADVRFGGAYGYRASFVAGQLQSGRCYLGTGRPLGTSSDFPVGAVRPNGRSR
jgi:hypothetical protein